jgi:menaquinone-dependent protoporphyrinogen IX oxidase
MIEDGETAEVAAELLSFLKELGAAQIWTEKDLSKALKIAVAQANKVIADSEINALVRASTLVFQSL